MKTLVIVGGVLGSMFLLLAAVVMYALGVYNQANTLENSLKAEQENNRNILSNYGKKVAEAVQVTDMQRDDLTKVVKATMEGRYGENGSKAVFQWITENNMQLNSAVYTKVQQIIEAGRNEFRQGQTKLISVKQSYETVLGSMPRGFVMKLVGYPKINLDEYKIVSDDRTDTAFKSKKEEAIKLR